MGSKIGFKLYGVNLQIKHTLPISCSYKGDYDIICRSTTLSSTYLLFTILTFELLNKVNMYKPAKLKAPF